MAMALSLPSNFPEREMLVVTTFGVALFTLLIPGLSMEFLVKHLRLSGMKTPAEAQLQNELVKLEREKAELIKQVKSRQLSKKDYQAQLKESETRRSETEQMLELLETGMAEPDGERLKIETALLRAQRECLIHLSKTESSKPEVLQEFREKIDSRYLEIKIP